MISSFEYILPVIRGIQAGREYYVSMCPVRLLPKLFPIQGEELAPEKRSNRCLNRSRIPEIAKYIINNPENYTLGAIAASIDAKITFEPLGNEAESRKIGRLRVPMDATFTINDGQHRRVAYQMALKENPELGYETIALILYLDLGLERSQQMFADFNRFQVPIDASLDILYEHREVKANLVKAVVQRVEVFRCLTEMEKGTLSTKSDKLFTLSSISHATLSLLVNYADWGIEKQVELAADFWNVICGLMAEWELVLRGRLTAAKVRQDYVHCHGLVLSSLANIGADLLDIDPDHWRECLGGLQEVDWSISNPDWQGHILCKGGVSKSKVSLGWMRGYLQRRLGLVV
ncbi:DNA sulfur modification protein DndB [Kamptonema animale CS-326]|jgi:DNA sulfur modification protein DndB|uniref:DNA sulfur modification protein DndB n=1 Tax=Kamptonema animale TaxID=92934 RepID=UPI00232AB84B|nr:DNA sulfur modification protein DndB [Kamptonema animale]MDB9511979.1 DNA sulfur modification protein DndB [Kamptonema animale CS-326]